MNSTRGEGGTLGGFGTRGPTGVEGRWKPRRLFELRWIAYPAIACVGLVFLVSSLQLGLWLDGRPGIGLFPAIVSALLVAMSILTVIGQVRGVPGTLVEGGLAAEVSPVAGEATETVPWRVAVIMVYLLVYALLVGRLGHIIAASLISSGVIKLIARDRPWWFVVTSGAAIGLASYFLFEWILEMPMPGR